VGTSSIYESQDSSYTQLDVSNASAPIVRTTDGTQFTFTPVTIDSEYRCTQIKDRNGNYITATYNTTNGHLLKITELFRKRSRADHHRCSRSHDDLQLQQPAPGDGHHLWRACKRSGDPNVTFGYDAAANRTSMTDGLGSVSYGYDQLSRLTSETRTFTGLGSYALSYGYNLAGEVTSITNPWGVQVGYGYDNTGRPTSVSGSGYAGVSSYVSSMSYRAFGLKQMGYRHSSHIASRATKEMATEAMKR